MSKIEPLQNRRVNIRGIIIKDGRLFCQKLKHSHTMRTNKYWSTPGGGIDFGESLQEGLTREIIEETGVKPEIGNLLFVQQFMDGGREQLEFFFHIRNADAYETLDLSKTSHGTIEVDTCGFVDPDTTNILPAFLTRIDLEKAVADSREVPVSYEGR